MNEISRKPAHTVTDLASARQHQENWPTIMERAVEGVVVEGMTRRNGIFSISSVPTKIQG